MTKRSLRLFWVILILLVLMGLAWRVISPRVVHLTPTSSSINSDSTSQVATAQSQISPQEQPVTVIHLSGPASEPRAEISGMAWYNETLILLPQYPSRFGSGDGAVFGLTKDDILAYLDGTKTEPLSPREIPFIAPGIEKIRGFEGFEAIAFSDDQVFLTIEAKPNKMMGYLIEGIIDPYLNELRLDSSTLIENPPQVQISNMSDEALLVTPHGVLSFYEANGTKVNPSPTVHLFSLTGQPQGTLPMASIEYRLTDVTPLDANYRFWGINYFYPGDTILTPEVDPLTVMYGQGSTHTSSKTVERLVQFQYTDDGISIANTHPIQLQLLPDDEARNWEAIAPLDQLGFLLATDKFPETIFAFVGYP